MRKIGLLLGTFIAALFISCEGPEGPMGPPGFNGEDGINILGQVIEVQGNFNAGNDYSITYNFPQSIEVFETDVVLVYILWDQVANGNNAPIDIWRLLPQTRLLDQGTLIYNYDHTFRDVGIFLEADFNLGTLAPGDTQNQIFRIAVLPAEKLAGAKMDKSNINNVMSTLGIGEKDVQHFRLD